jgi:aspartate aminotransferase-like enzyme
MPHLKLFIPGPIEVSPKTYEAFCKPMVGHRSKEFQALYARVQPGLQELFVTRQPVFVNTGSAWSVMEASIRNLTVKKALTCMNGAFSDKWYDVALKCGKAAEKLQVEWGQPIKPEQIDAKLATGEFDTLTLIHNETSTGTMSPLFEIAKLKKKYPDVMFVVDVVSSLSVLRLPFDELGLDVMLAGTQKALALPPGAAVFTVSEAAYARSAGIKDRGYYLDFHEFKKNHESNMTPTTPSISHFYALESKLAEMRAEGWDNRFARHLKNAEITRAWVKKQGFELFPEAGYEAIGLTCVKNSRGVDVPKLLAWLKENHKIVLDGGYGKIKGATFRISHMGDETTANIEQLLGWLDDGLAAIA